MALFALTLTPIIVLLRVALAFKKMLPDNGESSRFEYSTLNWKLQLIQLVGVFATLITPFMATILLEEEDAAEFQFLFRVAISLNSVMSDTEGVMSITKNRLDSIRILNSDLSMSV